MKRYLKLVNFEFNRFAKIFAVLLGMTLVAQVAGVIVKAKEYLNNANEAIHENMMSITDFLSQNGPMGFEQIVSSIWFLGPIALCIAAAAFYVFLIWYRDWFGKNTFIYRLLMLPTARLNVFYAKLTTIVLATLGFVAFQLIILPLEMKILQWMLPNDFESAMGINGIFNSLPELRVIFPESFLEFLLYYGTGMTAVAVIFTAILFERSFRWKGIFAGIGYGLLVVFVFISPLLLDEFVLDGFFYTGELFLLMIAAVFIVLAGSIWLSGYLLKKKIRV